MPVQYAGVIDEHMAVRTDAGLFDVSHMGELTVQGDGAHAFLQQMLSNDLDRIGPYQAQYTLLPNETGGIVDDLIAYREPDGGYLLVVNAGNTAAAFEHLRASTPAGVELVNRSDDYAMVALQGPRSFEVLARVMDEELQEDGAVRSAATMPPFSWGRTCIADCDCRIARTGYTGEPGVELFCAPGDAATVWDALLANGVAPCGLGARDTLRLEVCYPLHGNDITPETNAIEAGLGWVCVLGKDFTGADVLRRTKEEGPKRRLAAFRMTEKAIPRGGLPIVDDGGEPIGVVTSGTHSPSLGIGIGMGYVPSAVAEPGTSITIDVRGRLRSAEIARKPLYSKET
jgi:aminomethyltransferase